MSYQPQEWSALSGPPSGFKCRKPYRYEYQAEAYQRDCGKCARCLAAKKRDVTARAAAEALTSDEAVFLTLTYRPGERGAFEWVTKDRQAFMKRLRSRLWAAAEKRICPLSARQRRKLPKAERDEWKQKIAVATQRVRYFGMGEVGEKNTKRNHWHIVLFFTRGENGSSGFTTTPRDRDGKQGREIIDLWPHGFVNVEVLPETVSDRVSAIRYCTMYLHKRSQEFTSCGVTRRASVPFRSMKPALGAEYLAQEGRRHADAGLPLPSFYKVPGVSYSKGFRKGQLVKNYLTGVIRREVILAYRDQWQANWGGLAVPHSDFLKRFDPDYCEPDRNPARARRIWRKRDGSARTPIPPVPSGLVGYLAVTVGRDAAGVVCMLPNGVCVWSPENGDPSIVNDGDAAPFLDGDGVGLSAVTAWIEARRGKDWQSPRDRFAFFEARRVARVEAVEKALPHGVAVGPWGDPGPAPLTGRWRFVRLRSFRRNVVRLDVVTRADGSKRKVRVYDFAPLIGSDGAVMRREFYQDTPADLVDAWIMAELEARPEGKRLQEAKAAVAVQRAISVGDPDKFFAGWSVDDIREWFKEQEAGAVVADDVPSVAARAAPGAEWRTRCLLDLAELQVELLRPDYLAAVQAGDRRAQSRLLRKKRKAEALIDSGAIAQNCSCRVCHPAEFVRPEVWGAKDRYTKKVKAVLP